MAFPLAFQVSSNASLFTGQVWHALDAPWFAPPGLGTKTFITAIFKKSTLFTSEDVLRSGKFQILPILWSTPQ